MNEYVYSAKEKIINNQRIDFADAMALYYHEDLLMLAQLARKAKEAKSGRHVYFNVNRHINLSNICQSGCPLCAFACKSGEEQAFVLETADVEKIVRQAVKGTPDLTEIHIVSALNPEKAFSYYMNIIETVRREAPHVHIKAFTPVEISHFSQISGYSVKAVLEKLKEAGLHSLPGGGAEILDDEVRQIICPNKASTAQWIEVIRTAHKLNIPTNATMLYGHIETVAQRIRHLLTIRDIQDETGGFQGFVAFPFHPGNTDLAATHTVNRVSAWEDLKMIAIARLILDNVEHIKAFWMMLTLPVAQLSLAFGVDDFDGTVVEEKIIHAAGAKTKSGITKKELIALIRETGLIPVERDTFYHHLKVYDGEKQG
ncbi:MAG TPA: aminofutalosine synthase MqnE [Methylomusa anaerophila]|uniref:Aminodeoxyfutalosine synthase n=1 Tax=Methylomusa anaerophila TaxID=1930071 RepID=A0A348AML2_9FIRM|nr:aminofutalosine synthase MqnE [Methylomusa anaerophila]BBB92310.1 aminodeoxyfutalosine synthase [Methylomusa anaerophila]HML90229.1 aminofutalosine synthase MqnE [Methylomusa anaerophila]